MRNTPFFRQADLLVQVVPFVNAEACCALKGGTALNFFLRDFPRLSVDIDLVYLPLEDRPTTLRGRPPGAPGRGEFIGAAQRGEFIGAAQRGEFIGHGRDR